MESKIYCTCTSFCGQNHSKNFDRRNQLDRTQCGVTSAPDIRRLLCFPLLSLRVVSTAQASVQSSFFPLRIFIWLRVASFLCNRLTPLTAWWGLQRYPRMCSQQRVRGDVSWVLCGISSSQMLLFMILKSPSCVKQESSVHISVNRKRELST
jgi:hypothetical protein